MATQQQSIHNPSLCDICQQRPKFGSFNFCGKNCAAQAATLCANCHQKPKFAGFEYCGKNCASQAKPQQPQQATVPTQGKGRGPGQQKGQQKVAGASGRNGAALPTPNQVVNALAQILPHLPQQGKAGQAANVASQLLPHMQAMMQQQQVPPPAPPALTNPAVLPQQRHGNTNGAGTGTTAHAPFTNKTNTQARTVPVASGGSGSSSGSANPSAFNPPSTAPGTAPAPPVIVTAHASSCLLPGCAKPAFIDPKSGQSSSYCSIVHRQEAVTQGIANACIMCLKFPQSAEDHFCSKGCRDEALSAPL